MTDTSLILPRTQLIVRASSTGVPDIATAARWVNERHAIFLRKILLEGEVPQKEYAPVFPLIESQTWTLDHLTDDPILSQWRATNVIRELDTVTAWIKENIRKPFADHPELWFMLAAGRILNWPPTLRMLIDTDGAWPSHAGFKPENMTAALEGWQAAGNKIEGGAYRLRAENNKSKQWYPWSKQRYMSEIVLGGLWQRRDRLMRLFDTGPTMHRVWGELQNDCYYGWGPFYAGQWTTDLAHTRYLRQAPDVASWAALGPGSRKGLNLLHGRPIDSGRPIDDPLAQEKGLREMREIQRQLPDHLAEWVPKQIALTDIQNICCEISKYIPLKDGSRAKAKVKYVPGRGW